MHPVFFAALSWITAAACAGTTPSAAATAGAPRVAETWGFTAPWDRRSDSSVAAHGASLDVVVSGWMQLDSLTGQPALLYRDDPSRARGARRFALVTSWQGQHFHPEMIRRVADDRGALALTASRVAQALVTGGYAGAVLDLEGQAREDVPRTLRIVRAIADSAHRAGVSVVALAIPAADTAAYPTAALAKIVDVLVVMLYDEHWSTSSPGPIATPLWVRRTLGRRVADVGAAHLVAALPVYGYLWHVNQPAQPVSFDEARRDAAQANVDLVRDPTSGSLHATKPNDWDLWLSDAELFHTLVAEVTSLGVQRVALWRLGLEDPGVWRH
jgi:spore germination protein YaaH